MRKITVSLAVLAVAVSLVAAADLGPIEVGAIYPTGGGTAGRGGLDEYRGVQLAAEYVNARGGIGGRDVRIRFEQADSPDQALPAVARLASADVPVILGSYGSTISRRVADAAQQRGIVFWETGAVGELSMAAATGDRVFRFAPTGGALGRNAVSFAREQLLPRLGRTASKLRYSVVYVDDDYGRSVGEGALAQIHEDGLTLAGAFPYRLLDADYADIVAKIKAARTDVLFVSAYLQDGIALRRESVRQRLPLIASVGTSSSYCMHEFGAALGTDAVGLYASDKPDGHVLDPVKLSTGAGAALRWAREAFLDRFDHHMTAPALTGFAGALALFRHVMPEASSLDPDSIAVAARAVQLAPGALPNGSGLAFGDAGTTGATDNLRAISVIWEWVAPGERAVVWPPAFASRPILPLEL